MDRLEAIIRSTDDCPPMYLSVYSIALGLGTLKAKESQKGADDFLQFFGAEGRI